MRISLNITSFSGAKGHPFGSQEVTLLVASKPRHCMQRRVFSSAAYRSNSYRHGFNGKEKETDGTTDNYDFGARIYDGRLGRFLSVDEYSFKFTFFSAFCISGNNPINAIDINGDSLYILAYTTGNERGDDMFKAAALTRQYDIENSANFDPLRDKVVLITVTDMSKLEVSVEKAVEQNKGPYGQTAEFDIYSHAGTDGPVGTAPCGEDPLHKSTDINPVTGQAYGTNSKQMNMTGWSKIDFNFYSNGRAGFYGCNTGTDPEGEKASFVTTLSSQSNMKDITVMGQTGSAFPSQFTNTHNTSFTQAVGTFLPVVQSKLDCPINPSESETMVRKTYMVGGTEAKVLTSENAKPLRVCKNGIGTVKPSNFQNGDKSE